MKIWCGQRKKQSERDKNEVGGEKLWFELNFVQFSFVQLAFNWMMNLRNDVAAVNWVELLKIDVL